MTACEIISIGDELLVGQVVNTNAAWLGRELAGIGLSVVRVVCVGDDRGQIREAITTALDRTPWLFVTGGLGPTKDDMTKPALIDVFGGEMLFSEGTWQRIRRIFEKLEKDPQESHRLQCFLPSTAKLLHNAMGTAPGMVFRNGQTTAFVMPGVPYEMEYILREHVIPHIMASGQLPGIAYRTICTVGEGESVLAERIADIEDGLPAGLAIAYLPAPGRVRIRVHGRGENAEAVRKTVHSITGQIVGRLGDLVYATEDIPLAQALGNRLRVAGRTLSVAESCTGGYLGHLITAVPSSSDYFEGGAITYSNELKRSVLGVQAATLERFGAVSEETVCEMAEGARLHFATDFALAVSGIAGPSGGTNDKPVGTMWIALAGPEGVSARRYQFGKKRLINIELSAIAALDMLRRSIDKLHSE